MCRWVTSLSGDCWLNLDRLDGINIQGSDRNGWLVVAERRGAPNTILGRYESKGAAMIRIRELIGDLE